MVAEAKTREVTFLVLDLLSGPDDIEQEKIPVGNFIQVIVWLY